jgi:glycosyltransferase involved in cell wall biosynthesis
VNGFAYRSGRSYLKAALLVGGALAALALIAFVSAPAGAAFGIGTLVPLALVARERTSSTLDPNTPIGGRDRAARLLRAVDRIPSVSVIIPTLNEAENLERVLPQLPEGLHEVVLVDGRSTDDTVAVARRHIPGVRVVTQVGKGKGDALREGIEAATGNVIVTLDADGSADPAEIPDFVDRLRDGADFAKGSRFLDGGGSSDITALRRLGNRALVGLVNALYGTRYTDLCYGYNAFWADCIPDIAVDCPGFEVETVVNLRVTNAGLDVVEVPSFEHDRLFGASNLRTFRDGFRVLRAIFRESRLNPHAWRHQQRAIRTDQGAAAF